MEGYEPQTYGSSWADCYDDTFGPAGPEVIDFLAARSEGDVFELAIGTGRIALPLAQRGLNVTGLDISTEMVEMLATKPGAAEIDVVMGDMTDFTTSRRHSLILLAFNTLFGPLSEEKQAGVFRSVAQALLPDRGRFVIDCFVPDLGRFDRGQTVRVRTIDVDRVHLDYSIHEPDTQIIRTMSEVRWTDGRSALLPVWVRYLFPDQIDAMAASAGLHLAERYQWYDETPFGPDSPTHVSVYVKPS